ncbi:MAG: NADH-quinone oxidoreductase subunit J [Prevotellaceae bacterium]|jgi:NADH-quinone oxidoreductase subunit J|nr:NADH-quinone oxidoreductase subunit J [Prevotellaceae bacterium]
MEQIIFYTLAAVITVFSVLAVTTKWLIRSATFLLFVLLCVAGLYLMLNYHYLFAVQTAVYAGGVMVLFIFGILLTHRPGEKISVKPLKNRFAALLLSIIGIVFCGHIITASISRVVYTLAEKDEIPVQHLGEALLGTEKFQYLLPFELISVLLLACIVGGIMIARKR